LMLLVKRYPQFIYIYINIIYFYLFYYSYEAGKKLLKLNEMNE
jgi:hypothetical protein